MKDKTKSLEEVIRKTFHRNGLNYSQMVDGDKTSDTWVSMLLDGFNKAITQTLQAVEEHECILEREKKER